MNGNAQTFRPSPLFQVFYLAPILLAVVFLVAFVRQPTRENGVIVAAIVIVAILAVPRALARVTLEEDVLTLSMPLRQPRALRLRQLISVERSSRVGHALLLRYHPMDDRGRLDIAGEAFLGLVPLEEQYLLEERLRAVVGDEDVAGG